MLLGIKGTKSRWRHQAWHQVNLNNTKKNKTKKAKYNPASGWPRLRNLTLQKNTENE